MLPILTLQVDVNIYFLDIKYNILFKITNNLI